MSDRVIIAILLASLASTILALSAGISWLRYRAHKQPTDIRGLAFTWLAWKWLGIWTLRSIIIVAIGIWRWDLPVDAWSVWLRMLGFWTTIYLAVHIAYEVFKRRLIKFLLYLIGMEFHYQVDANPTAVKLLAVILIFFVIPTKSDIVKQWIDLSGPDQVKYEIKRMKLSPDSQEMNVFVFDFRYDDLHLSDQLYIRLKRIGRQVYRMPVMGHLVTKEEAEDLDPRVVDILKDVNGKLAIWGELYSNMVYERMRRIRSRDESSLGRYFPSVYEVWSPIDEEKKYAAVPEIAIQVVNANLLFMLAEADDDSIKWEEARGAFETLGAMSSVFDDPTIAIATDQVLTKEEYKRAHLCQALLGEAYCYKNLGRDEEARGKFAESESMAEGLEGFEEAQFRAAFQLADYLYKDFKEYKATSPEAMTAYDGAMSRYKKIAEKGSSVMDTEAITRAKARIEALNRHRSSIRSRQAG